MKVAIILLHPFSESMGSVVRVRELAFSLGKFGEEVYIFTPYERSFDLCPNVHVVSMSRLINTIGLSKTVYRLSKLLYYNKVFPSLFSKVDSLSNRFVNRIIASLTKSFIDKGIDIIQVEQDVALPIGIGLKAGTGLPLIVDLHNISSEELIAAKVLERESNEFVAFQNATKNLLSHADHVVVVSHSMQAYVARNFGLSSLGVSVVPPGGRVMIDKSAIEKRDKPVKVVYAGLVAYREQVDLFVKSMPFIQRCNRDAQFYITNRGEAVNRIKALTNRLGVKPEFFWYDSYDEVNNFLSSCHTGVLFSSDNAARQMGTPAKLFNYMSVGLPIVANANGGWTEIIEKEGVGLLSSDDPRNFGETVSSLISNPKLMREFAFNGLDLVLRKYNWDISAGILFKAYENLAD